MCNFNKGPTMKSTLKLPKFDTEWEEGMMIVEDQVCDYIQSQRILTTAIRLGSLNAQRKLLKDCISYGGYDDAKRAEWQRKLDRIEKIIPMLKEDLERAKNFCVPSCDIT